MVTQPPAMAPNAARMLARGAALVCALLSLPAAAQGIYTCTDAKGRRLTSDRPIIECLDREQRVMNKDGSTRSVLPPSLTADERAELETKERRRAQERMAHQEAVRRDRLLLSRYPSEAEHRAAREAALDDVRQSIRNSERRIAELQNERKPLASEAEFYKGKALPAKLKQSIEFVDVAVEAHATLIQNQQAEMKRINQLFDSELTRLTRLWAGAAPGSLAEADEKAGAATAGGRRTR
ncbi:exonuclease SbcC [Caldimonas brevitalea]|uniref:Exonuclease SbcC n=2 Tax=Caldimonas brevitalea TaxID=413882 RepID=A0A0G3BBU6_9BURK|nr:exonuclease SbcC [Caldimonas brevitalea]